MIILGVETSCDETAAAVVKLDSKTNEILVLSNVIFSQIAIHQKFGGVIPEIAAREHVLTIIPVIHEALKKAKISPKQLDYLAVTKGPGLITSLLAGTETIRTLAYAWQKPVIEVNHIAGHIFANFIEHKSEIKFPALILTVSGGHTNLVLMNKDKKIRIIGETLDDAAGEAFDKGAKMMDLGYPGGPKIAALAEEYKNKISQKSINSRKGSQFGVDKLSQSSINLSKSSNKLSQSKFKPIKLPQPMINSNNYDFSFSGLKTALLYQLKADKNWRQRLAEYAFYYQEAIIEVLAKKTLKAAQDKKVKTVMLSGGVSANTELRQRLGQAVEKELKNVNFLAPRLEYTTDNAAMIATAALFLAKNKQFKTYAQISADPSWKLK